MQLEIATGFYQSDSLPLAAQRCINYEPVIPQASALNQRALFDPRGIAAKSLTGDSIVGINRGAAVVNGVPYFVTGQNLYSIDSDSVVTDHGDIDGSARVSMAHNGRFLVIVVPGDKAYTFDNTDDTLAKITDKDFQVSDTVTFKDGYFTFTTSDGNQFFVPLGCRPHHDEHALPRIFGIFQTNIDMNAIRPDVNVPLVSQIATTPLLVLLRPLLF